MPLAQEYAAIGLIVGAWRAVFFRQVRAALTLIECGLPNEAQANMRAASEHAALLATLEEHRTAGTVEAFMQDVVLEVHRQAEGQLKVLRRIAVAAPHAGRALLAAVENVAGGKRAKGLRWDGTQLALFRALPGLRRRGHLPGRSQHRRTPATTSCWLSPWTCSARWSRCPEHVIVHRDAGYDYRPCRAELADRDLNWAIPKPGTPVQVGRRWVVEAANSWLNDFGRLRRCTERCEAVVQA